MATYFTPVIETATGRFELTIPDELDLGERLIEQLYDDDPRSRTVLWHAALAPTRIWWLDDLRTPSEDFPPILVGNGSPAAQELPDSAFTYRYLINIDRNRYVDLTEVPTTHSRTGATFRRNPLPVLTATMWPSRAAVYSPDDLANQHLLAGAAGAWAGDRILATNERDAIIGAARQDFPYRALATVNPGEYLREDDAQRHAHTVA